MEPPPETPRLAEARQRIRNARGIVVLTGAGVSAESGVPTFRDAGGYWGEHRPEDLATPGAFLRDPVLVWSWYDHRRRALARCAPNLGHLALARALEAREDLTLVTQNVDGLHHRATLAVGGGVPHPRIHELHGSISRVRCSRPGCHRESEHLDPVDATSEATLPRCPEPGCGALLRPAVVWFGEMLPPAPLQASFDAALEAELCIVAGTSAVVHPAASIPEATLRGGGTVVEVNPEDTPLSSRAHFRLRGPSAIILPMLLAPDPPGG